MRRRHRTNKMSVAGGLGLLVLVLPLLPLHAQQKVDGPTLEGRPGVEEPPQDPDDIVVVGRLADEESIRRDARLFGRKVEAAPVDGQVARWNGPICPRVSGIDQRLQNVVVSKINSIARDVGAPVGTEGCRANVIVTFTTDAKGLVAAIERRDSRALSSATTQERTILRDSPLAVRWWYTTLTEGSDGTQLGAESPALMSQWAVIPTTGNERYLSSYRSSLIDSKFRASIIGTAVLVDANHAKGRTLSAVASYVAFVALARIRVASGFTGAPSILGLFSADASNTGTLTGWDKAYLTALYRTPVGRAAHVQRSQIVGEMLKVMKSKDAKGSSDTGPR